MSESIAVVLNGVPSEVARGTSVAVAMFQAAQPCRISVTGEPRTALCGMGVCFECRAVVDGVFHRRTCQIVCEPGMRVETQR